MGKEIATIDSSGAVAVSKKRAIFTGVQTFTEDGLLVPKRNWQVIKKQTDSITRKHDAVSISGILTGFATTIVLVPVAATVGDSAILFTCAGLGFALCMGSVFSWMSGGGGKSVSKVVQAHSLQIDQWLFDRYGININSEEQQIQLGHIALHGMEKGKTVQFTATDGNNYMLDQTTEGALYVKPIIYNLATPEKVHEVEASTTPSITALQEPDVQMDENVRLLIGKVKNDVNVLKTYNLPAEQQHAVTRAMDEANQAVTTFMRMRKLDPEADSIETVDILTLTCEELSLIKQNIVENLREELKVVSAHKTQDRDGRFAFLD